MLTIVYFFFFPMKQRAKPNSRTTFLGTTFGQTNEALWHNFETDHLQFTYGRKGEVTVRK